MHFDEVRLSVIVAICLTIPISASFHFTMASTWSLEEEETLIDFYSKNECLHNKNHADYNYNRKNKLLGELVKELNKKSIDKKFKVEMVSSHWNELRNIYNKYKREVITGMLLECRLFLLKLIIF